MRSRTIGDFEMAIWERTGEKNISWKEIWFFTDNIHAKGHYLQARRLISGSSASVKNQIWSLANWNQVLRITSNLDSWNFWLVFTDTKISSKWAKAAEVCGTGILNRLATLGVTSSMFPRWFQCLWTCAELSLVLWMIKNKNNRIQVTITATLWSTRDLDPYRVHIWLHVGGSFFMMEDHLLITSRVSIIEHQTPKTLSRPRCSRLRWELLTCCKSTIRTCSNLNSRWIVELLNLPKHFFLLLVRLLVLTSHLLVCSFSWSTAGALLQLPSVTPPPWSSSVEGRTEEASTGKS